MLTVNRNDAQKKYHQTRLIYLCIMGTLFIYAFFVEMIKRRQDFMSSPDTSLGLDALRYVLIGLCIAMFFVIRLLRKHLISKIVQRTENPAAALATMDITTAALCESVAIYGLVLFFIGKRPEDFYLLMALSLTYFSIFFPRYSRWDELLKRIRP